MLYKVVTLTVGDKTSNDEASRALSREAKKGFIVTNVTTAFSPEGELISNYLLQRVPIRHLDNEPGDPANLRRILLGNDVFYWDPCGDDDEPTDD